MSEKTIRVRVGRVPGTVTYIGLPAGANSKNALEEAAKVLGFKLNTEAYNEGGKTMVDVPNINGEDQCVRDAQGNITEVFWNTEIQDGDKVLIIPQVKGNQMVVEAGRAPGRLIDIAVEDGSSAREVLAAAGIKLVEGDMVTINGEEAEADDEVGEGDSVIAISKSLLKPNVPSTVIVGRLREQLKVVEISDGDDLEDVVHANIDAFDGDEEVVVHNGATTNAKRLNGVAVNAGDSIVVRKKL